MHGSWKTENPIPPGRDRQAPNERRGQASLNYGRQWMKKNRFDIRKEEIHGKDEEAVNRPLRIYSGSQ
jgi:hypothetical protein